MSAGTEKTKSDYNISFSIENKKSSTIQLDSTIINRFIYSFPLFAQLQNELKEFYKKRSYTYVWFDENGITEPAEILYDKIINISDEGVPDKMIYKKAFADMMENRLSDSESKRALLEIMLTAQYLSYAKLVCSGISRREIESLGWLLPGKECKANQMIDSLIKVKHIPGVFPMFYQYDLLKKKLGRLDEINKKGGFIHVDYDKRAIHPGDTSVMFSEVRRFLFQNEDITKDNGSLIYDDELETGLKNYQKRMGLKVNGVINEALIQSMNIPIEKRIRQIVVNMERCRWIPVETPGDFIVINIPDYKLYLFENDSMLWDMKIIAGKYQNPTMVFTGKIKYVVFSPYWNVPPGIMKKEIIPAMSRNKNYLSNHDMEWHEGNIRQRPGPNNPLGRIKFVFPNSHNIYMHDTPLKSLFEEDKRSFSHGCIRLSDALKLAKYLLRKHSEWSEEKIMSSMNSGKEQFVTLKYQMPVFITYFTCWVDKSGKINFRNDIYQKDERLAKMILEKPSL